MKKKPLIFSAQARREYEEIAKERERMSAYVRKARYKKFFDLAKRTYKDHPRNRFALYRYAVALGDSREWVSEKQHKKNQKKAARLLNTLLRKTRGIDPRWVKVFRNEYYWFSKQPYRQYRLGIDHLKLGKDNLYSAGVGATSLAISRLEENKVVQGRRWAKKAIAAWESFFTSVDNYYNAYVWYAKALGLNGDAIGMEKALKKAARLAKRPLTYQEFRRARAEVARLTENL